MTVVAELSRGRVSIECDLCIPPVLTVNSPAELRRTGWVLAFDSTDDDVCPNCVLRGTGSRRRDQTPAAIDPGRLPNVIVVGATKAGTTAVHRYLAMHPEITEPADGHKEMRFFTDPRHRDWLGLYQRHFEPGTRYRIESTPYYSAVPVWPGVVDRLADLVPDARLIYLVRDPIDRIIAEWVEGMHWGSVERSLDAALTDPADPTNLFVASSRYGTQLRELHRRFAPDRVLVVDQADLAGDTRQVVADTLAFLDLEPIELSEDDVRPANTRETKRAFPDWTHRLRQSGPARLLHRMPERHRQAVSGFVWRRLQKPVEVPALSPELRVALERVLRPEIDDLRLLTGRPFANWSV